MVSILRKRINPRYIVGILVILLLVALSFSFLGGFGTKIQEALSSSDLSSLTAEEAAHRQAVTTGKTLGFISLIPVLLTVVLAFVTKEVSISLLAGLLSGLVIMAGTSGTGGFLERIAGVFSTACTTVLEVATDSFRGAIIILCLSIGGMVAVINSSGGFAALGQKITKGINSPKRAAFMAQVLGMCLFFDDYANSLITGPLMRDITDKQGVSREKLAYIVDSTAAPVAGIAIISSWIAAELSAIESGFVIAGVEGSAYAHFLGSIPFCFYNFVAIIFVFGTTLMGREYGPMLRAERRARAGEPLKLTAENRTEASDNGAVLEAGSIWAALIPVLTLILYALVGFYTNGIKNAVAAGIISPNPGFSFDLIPTAFGNADTVIILMQAAVLASALAIFIGCVTRRLTLVSGITDWINGASTILLTVVILALAWGLSSVIEQLGAAYYLVDLVTLALPYWLLPALIFLACCVISFAAGSFGCMVIVMPIAVPVAYQALATAGISYGDQYIFACVAAVLSGSIFGDHCSPVTDTTILSSIGAGCENLDHVKTQLPYALTVAVIAASLGYLPAGLGVSPAISIPLAIITALLVIRFAGKKVEIKETNSGTEQVS